MDNYSTLFLFFVIYSFLGWLLETIFARLKDGEFVNRGFLAGCVCPIYGFGAVLILKVSSWANIYTKDYFSYMLISILSSIILVTALEFVAGFILEKLFNCKWWDYSDNYANIHGYICLKYSIIWGAIAFLLVQILHPLTIELVSSISYGVKFYFIVLFLIYFIIDTIMSVRDALKLQKVIRNYSNFSIEKYYIKLLRYKRFFAACPRLLLNANIINEEVRRVISDKIDKIKIQFKNRFQE